MTKRADVLPKPTPIGLRREEAAAYVGLSPNKFDQAVACGQMPEPLNICGVKVWFVKSLEKALDSDIEMLNPWTCT